MCLRQSQLDKRIPELSTHRTCQHQIGLPWPEVASVCTRWKKPENVLDIEFPDPARSHPDCSSPVWKIPWPGSFQSENVHHHATWFGHHRSRPEAGGKNVQYFLPGLLQLLRVILPGPSHAH